MNNKDIDIPAPAIPPEELQGFAEEYPWFNAARVAAANRSGIPLPEHIKLRQEVRPLLGRTVWTVAETDAGPSAGTVAAESARDMYETADEGIAAAAAISEEVVSTAATTGTNAAEGPVQAQPADEGVVSVEPEADRAAVKPEADNAVGESLAEEPEADMAAGEPLTGKPESDRTSNEPEADDRTVGESFTGEPGTDITDAEPLSGEPEAGITDTGPISDEFGADMVAEPKTDMTDEGPVSDESGAGMTAEPVAESETDITAVEPVAQPEKSMSEKQRQAVPATGGDEQQEEKEANESVDEEIIDKFIAGGEHKIVPRESTPEYIPGDGSGLPVDDELITEDLAEIYMDQELFGPAIAIYERLSLLYPEKSIYFAEIIEKARVMAEEDKKR